VFGFNATASTNFHSPVSSSRRNRARSANTRVFPRARSLQYCTV
jgi:hypothetical protein